MATREPSVGSGDVLATQRMATGLAADVERLNALDDVWTGYLNAEPKPAMVERDLPELGHLVMEMRSAMMRVELGSHWLRDVIRDLDADLDEALQRALYHHSVGLALPSEYLPERPFAQQVAEACSIVVQEMPGEIELLMGKLLQLQNDGYSPGDIGGRLKCAILLVGAGASLIGLLIAPTAPVPGVVLGGAGILLSTLAAANGWSCKRAGDVATASRG